MALEPAHQRIARLHRSVLWGTVSVRMYVFTNDFPTLSVRILMEGITNSIPKMQKRERRACSYQVMSQATECFSSGVSNLTTLNSQMGKSEDKTPTCGSR